MATQTPLDSSGFMARLIREGLYESVGYVHVEGLSFRVWRDRLQIFMRPRIYDRPFTKTEYRADLWRRRRLRVKHFFVGPYREAKYRFGNAWDALKGAELDRY